MLPTICLREFLPFNPSTPWELNQKVPSRKQRTIKPSIHHQIHNLRIPWSWTAQPQEPWPVVPFIHPIGGCRCLLGMMPMGWWLRGEKSWGLYTASLPLGKVIAGILEKFLEKTESPNSSCLRSLALNKNTNKKHETDSSIITKAVKAIRAFLITEDTWAGHRSWHLCEKKKTREGLYIIHHIHSHANPCTRLGVLLFIYNS